MVQSTGTRAKRIVRRRERIWKKYKQQYQWKALSDERKMYRSILAIARCEVISSKVAECKESVKSLYNLVNHIAGEQKKTHYLNASMTNVWQILLQITSLRKYRRSGMHRRITHYMPQQSKKYPP